MGQLNLKRLLQGIMARFMQRYRRVLFREGQAQLPVPAAGTGPASLMMLRLLNCRGPRKLSSLMIRRRFHSGWHWPVCQSDPQGDSELVGWRARKHAGLIDVDIMASQLPDLGACDAS